MNITQYQAPATEHPFAQYVRTLGKGKTGSRSLSQAEAEAAFAMILRGEADPLQVGAFLMLLRVKEETGEELAGFVSACRQQMAAPPGALYSDLDWSSYAGKRQQHPWYILSLLLLAEAGHRVFIHGSDGHTPGRLYTEEALRQLGLPVAAGWQEVSAQLDSHRLSYLPLRQFCPPLHQLMQLRPLLGLRSPVNTLARMLNPLRAPASIQSIFHPAYANLHQETDRLLGQPRALVLKGDSGEVEIKPQADTTMHFLQAGQSGTLTFRRTRLHKPSPVDKPAVAPLLALWRGAVEDEYGLAATLATAAAALYVLAPEQGLDGAQHRAAQLWRQRNRERLD